MKLKSNIAVSDTGFIFNPTTGDSFSTNDTGLYIIQLLRQGKNKEEITALLCKEYRTDTTTAEKDFEDFQDMLLSLKLLSNEE